MKPTPQITLGARPMRRHRPPILAGEGMIVFAGLGGPGADAVLGAAHFDHARQVSVEGDPPVPAVAAQIHEPAAAIEPAPSWRPTSRVEWYSGWVPVMIDPIVLEQRIALAMQVLVGDHVVVDAVVIEPVEEVGVGIVLIERRAVAAEPGMIARREIQDRPEAARIAHAGAVGMAVVERAAEFGMVVHVEVGMAEVQQPPIVRSAPRAVMCSAWLA